MPHGLCMFCADGRLAVMNHRFSEMMQLSDKLVQRGGSASDIIDACVSAGSISAPSGRMILAEIENTQTRDMITTDPDIARNRSLSWTFQPMAGGGAVVLLEDITERRDAEARISHLARYDELTELPNRVNFRDEIGRLLSIQQGADQLSALLFVDLDQFKQVNDTLGHPCGDQLLCAVAGRMREMLRPEDFVARFGGDEFVVFQQNIRSHEDAAVLARRIVDRLSERYKIDNHLVEIGASVGIAMTTAGVSADTLLKNADMALYRAKADGRGTFCFFREEMAQTVEARRILELDLRKALANEEFELFYQPLVNLKSGRIATCEALLRWNHPVRGTVSPIDIIPVAEDMGLIVDLGRWILRKACMECMKWPELVSVAVNFSPQQFHQRDVLSEVRYALEVSGLPAHRLEIEITESSLLRNTQITHDVLSQLHSLGVRISLDDFGTGYSSLSYLHNFPLQKVKIDRSFLEGIDTDRPLTLLRGVARLSADLGMSVVVEGIETTEQLELISADGAVTEAQGYLFSRPVPAVRIRQLLNASHGRRAPDDQLIAVSSRSIA
jgi:diguanylate cyclase (GGDEF)-like protein